MYLVDTNIISATAPSKQGVPGELVIEAAEVVDRRHQVAREHVGDAVLRAADTDGERSGVVAARQGGRERLQKLPLPSANRALHVRQQPLRVKSVTLGRPVTTRDRFGARTGGEPP